MDRKFIPLSIPNFKGNELEYVTSALEAGWVSTGGKLITDFESMVADYVGSKGAVACQNGTSGIHTALLVAGVTAGDEVFVPSLTFIAAVNPVKYAGADPIFMDCDNSLSIDAAKLEQFCEKECKYEDGNLYNKTSGKQIKAIIVVHIFGNMANMVDVSIVANKYSLKIIEDATEALGTYYTEGPYKGKFAGTMGDIGVYSFNGNKIITTGGGGMIVSENPAYLDHAKHLTTQAKSDPFYYTHDEIGYNYRMTNLQAALGIAQLEQLELFIKIKQENYNLFKSEIEKFDGLKMLEFRENTRPNYWFYGIYCEDDCKYSRDVLIEMFTESKIQVRPIWALICDQLPYRANQKYLIERASQFVDRVINIPCSSSLTQSDVLDIVNRLNEKW